MFLKKRKKEEKKVSYHTPQKTCFGKFFITIWQISFIKKKRKEFATKYSLLKNICKIRKQKCIQLQAHTRVPYQLSQLKLHICGRLLTATHWTKSDYLPN